MAAGTPESKGQEGQCHSTGETVTTANLDTGEDTEIIAPPEGMVSTKEFIDAARVVCKAHTRWCEAVEGYLNQYLGLDFEERVWDYNGREYVVGPLTLTEPAPEFVSKLDILKLAKRLRRYYRAYDDVREFFIRFGGELLEYNDKWIVTIELNAHDLERAGYIVDDDTQADGEDLQSYATDAARNKLYRLPPERLAIKYVPDPKRAEPTGPNVSDEDTGTNAAE